MVLEWVERGNLLALLPSANACVVPWTIAFDAFVHTFGSPFLPPSSKASVLLGSMQTALGVLPSGSKDQLHHHEMVSLLRIPGIFDRTGATCQTYTSGTVEIAPGRIWPPRVVDMVDTCLGVRVMARTCPLSVSSLRWEGRMACASIRRKHGRTRGAAPASAAADSGHVVLGLCTGFNRSPATHVQR